MKTIVVAAAFLTLAMAVSGEQRHGSYVEPELYHGSDQCRYCYNDQSVASYCCYSLNDRNGCCRYTGGGSYNRPPGGSGSYPGSGGFGYNKPGRCPRPYYGRRRREVGPGIGSSRSWSNRPNYNSDRCSYDSDCPGYQKCCNLGGSYGKECTFPSSYNG